MNANFDRALSLVLQSEGGYVNDPQDPGGATNLGVTIGEAQAIGLDVNHDGHTDILDIKALTPADAGKVYKHFYWDQVAGDELPSGVDYAVFDLAVNSGVGRAAKFLQQVCAVTADGSIGPATLAAVRAKPAALVVGLVCDDRLAFLQTLPTWSHFGKGWASRVASVRAAALQMAGK